MLIETPVPPINLIPVAPAVNADPVGPSNIARSEAPDALGSRTSTIAGVPLLEDVYPF